MTDTSKIKTTIEDTLKLMKIAFDSVEVGTNDETGSPKFTIRTADSALLIGTKGAHLMALNHVIKKMASHGVEEDDAARFFIDVNNYQEKVEEEIKTKAKIMSERARSFKVDIELDPMSSYERMIVHAALQNIPDIKTESRGEGRNRRVVIKYVEPESKL
jgi:spoIIIJ-associated protein